MEKIIVSADNIKNELVELSRALYENPELSNEEHSSYLKHVELLKKYGFDVEEKYLGLPTAFKAVYGDENAHTTIAFMVEYDALPGVGHGCGHNILGATSTGAGIALASVAKELGGRVIVFGCPAEETDGAKVKMADMGAFDGVDAALVAHPENKHSKSGYSLAMQALRFEYFGKPSHAAAFPEAGINALDGAIGLFNGINALRQHIRSDARVHGIIKDGGKAANIVPDYACADFYVRATTKGYLNELIERIKNCAKGSALACGAELKISNYEATYDNMLTNETLSNVYCEKLLEMGCKKIFEPRKNFGSIDMGNVSQVCPSIHPYFDICGDEKTPAHTKEFADFSVTPYANEQMVITLKALALTGASIMSDSDLKNSIKEEFLSSKKVI